MPTLSICADIKWKHDNFDTSHPSVSFQNACLTYSARYNWLHSYQVKIVCFMPINLCFYDTIVTLLQ